MRPLTLSALAILANLCCVPANAQTLFSTLDENTKPHVRVGLSFRKISADFSVTSSTTLPFSSMANMGMGMGDVGLYDGVSGNKFYEDGSVGPNATAGAAMGAINDHSQIASTGRFFGGNQNYPVDEVTFTTMDMMSINESTVGTGGLTISDEDWVVGPYFDLVFPLYEEDDKFRNFVVGYRYYHSDLGFGPQVVGNQTAQTFANTYTYTYDYIDMAIPANPSDFPYNTTGDIIYDFMSYENTDFMGGIEDPRTSMTTGNTTVNFIAVSQTTLDVHLHEIPFGLECGRVFGKTSVALTAGGTINIVDLGMTSRTYYYQYGGLNMFYSRVSRYSDTPVKLGAYAGVNVTHPLNDDGGLYLNLHATYRWVDTITASTADISAEIDLSSFEGGVGIGFFFD